MNQKLPICAALATALTAGTAYATDGYFSHGYGMKAKGMAGASTAVAHDAFGGATNPATMAFAGDRWDVGVDWFSPHRDSSRNGSGPAGIDGTSESGENSFFIPEFAYNHMIRPDAALGVTVYGNGGMNTSYPGGEITSVAGTTTCNNFQTGGGGPVQASYNLLCGSGKLGVDLSQLIIAPTVAWKVSPSHSVGLSPLFGYQRFKADGLQAFAGFSSDASHLTNNGYDTASGWGARIGYFGNVTKEFSVGAAYSTKIAMSKFDKYRGLFAQEGGFDMPANWSIGAAWHPSNAWLVAVDYRRINYSGVNSVGNSSASIINCTGAGGTDPSACLGGSNGAGFGWTNVGVRKIGVEYAMDQNLTLRAGFGRSDNPIRSQDVTFNIVAPGVVRDHYTLGATYGLDKGSELTGAFMYAKRNSVTGQSLFAQFGLPATTTEKISMNEYSFGVAYARRY
jgi:long-chain fatty acid transport protein